MDKPIGDAIHAVETVLKEEPVTKRNRDRTTQNALAASRSLNGREQALTLLLDDVFMQPWFLPKPIYLAVRRLIPNIHLMKLRHYFDDYGCLRCGSDEALYGASGLCHPCNVVVRSRLMMCMKKRLKKASVKWEGTASDHFFDQMNLAQLILYGSHRETKSGARGKRGSRITVASQERPHSRSSARAGKRK